MSGDITKKVEYTVMQMKNLEAEAKMLKEESKRLSDRGKACERRSSRLKEDMAMCLETLGIKKMDAGLFKLSMGKAGGLAPLIYDRQPEEIPDEFRTVVYGYDNEKIREALGDGEVIDFAHLGERKEVLRIK